MEFKQRFSRRRYVVMAAILVFIFVLLTKIIAAFLVTHHVIYDTEAIWVKAEKMAAALTWPLSDLLPVGLVSSYYFIPFAFIYYWLLVIILSHCHAFLKNKKLYRWIVVSFALAFLTVRLNPNMLCALDDQKSSQSRGTSWNGSLMHGKRLAFEGNNFHYFNFLSYIKGNCFVHEKVKETLLDAYKTCETTCPGIEFTTGEGSLRRGGPYIINHRTHQNGMSLDLLLTFKKDSAAYYPAGLLNAYGYGLDTDEQGYINQSKPINWYPSHTQVDFETNARFLLALNEACEQNGVRIRLVILKVELVPLLLATPTGKKLQSQNVRFARALPSFVNQAHDDHFHVDFELTSP